MLIKEWLPEAIERHRQRHPAAWPEHDSEADRRFRRDWLSALIDVKARPDEFEAASRRLDGPATAFGEDHLPVLLGLIRSQREEPPIFAAPPSDRASAEKASRDCEHCGGSGLAPVYHPLHDGSPTRVVEADDGRRYTVPTRVMAHCTCPIGRWMRAKTGGDVLRRIPDFADIRDGKSRLLAYDPTADRVQGL